MSSVSDYSLANQGFSAFRTELNNILGAINTHNLATSAPSSLAAGSIWVDSSSAGTHTLKYYDGSDSITLCNVNTSANTVDFIDSSVTTELSGDSTPQLGGNLDTNSHNILIDDAHFIGDENGNEQIIFQTTGSAVNELEITNGATGNGPILGASGETNVDLHIKPKGSGKTVIGSAGASAYLTTSGTYDLVLDTNKGTNSGNITITDGANGNIDITTNGTGAIKFNDLAYIPQQALTSSSNAVAWDAQAAPNAYHQTSENTTLSAPSNAVEGSFICIEVNFNGSHTFSFNATFHFSADTAPTTTDTDGKTDIFVFRYNGSIWQEVGRTLNIPES